MGLNPKQKEAVEYLDGPLLVIAGPGTGKTQLLSRKVEYILNNTDTSPENILCMTFTEAGAQNMRERLKSFIGVKNAEKVNIGTYHSFGTEILGQYKNYSETYNRELDSAIDEVIQYKILKEIQNKLPATDILRGDSIANIREVISSAKSANLTADDLKQIAKQNIEDSEVISNLATLFLEKVVPRKFKESFENAYYPLYENLKNYADIPVILKNIDRSIKTLVTELGKAIEEAEATGKITALTSWRNKTFEKDENGQYKLNDRIANKKLASIAVVMEKYEQTMRENGLYDFNDMIIEAIKALKEDQGFRLTLSERYQVILLDEFQDTNPTQFEIIKLLTDYEKPLIMAVGDDDQAIFEFQGASATIMEEFQNHYGANVITLVENYRSTQEILDFSHSMIQHVDEDTRFSDKILHANKDQDGESKIERHEFISSDQEYSFIAEKISELIKSGVPQTEIAVISSKHKYFLPLLPYLKSHPEINIAYEKRDNLLENDKIHEILTISRFVYEIAYQKQPQTSIMEILSYPFWDISMLNVIKSINRAKESKKTALDYLAESEDENLRAIANFLANLVAKAYDTPLEVFLDYILGTRELSGFKSNFLNYYSQKSDYETLELYENLATLRDKMNRHFGNKSSKLIDLITMIEDYEAATAQISSSSPYRDSEDAIQILSAHKSKGLEFEYVFMIAMDNMSWGKAKGNNTTLSLPKNLIQIRHTGTTEGERVRLLYVAMTRAKKHLIMTNALKDFNEKSPERLSYLEEYQEDDNGEKIIVCDALPKRKIECHYQEKTVTENIESVKSWINRYIVPSPEMRSIFKERVENFKLSATALTSFIDIVYAGPESFFNSNILRAPAEPATESIIFGNLIHATFEKVTNSNITDEEAIQFFLDELEKTSMEPEVMNQLREKGPHDLLISLKKFGKILRQGKAEVNLSHEKLSIDGVPIIGTIDHIVIDEESKTIEIYDYKTGKFHAEKWDSQPALYKYRLQLGFYKLLLNLSPTYSKYKVEKAHILFVVPDRKDEEVHDKIYEFNEKEEEELIKLIKTVYSRVKTLDFLDDPELFISADKNKGIKDIKEFKDLLLQKS